MLQDDCAPQPAAAQRFAAADSGKSCAVPKPPLRRQRSSCGRTTTFLECSGAKRRCRPPAPGRWRGAATALRAEPDRRPHPRRAAAMLRTHRHRPSSRTRTSEAVDAAAVHGRSPPASPSPAAGTARRQYDRLLLSQRPAGRSHIRARSAHTREDHPHSGAWAENSLRIHKKLRKKSPRHVHICLPV